jgi:predicted esterase
MPKAQLAGGISIHYEDSAVDNPEHLARPAVLLLHGLGTQHVLQG